jgi:tRNA (cytidine32/uridine32-2'-O)-methyltransferase
MDIATSTPLNTMLGSICIVLVETTHPGNIGAAARALANMGLSDLRLVRPQVFPSPDAEARAASGEALLSAARVFSSLDDAIADCGLIVGSTARARSVSWPVMSPSEMAPVVLDSSRKQRTAILFGRESRGLTNKQLDRCQLFVTAPVDANHASLNLASAVLLLAYELRKSALLRDDSAVSDRPTTGKDLLATSDRVEGFVEHFERVLYAVGFLEQSSDKLFRKIRRIFTRRALEEDDVNILRGVLSAIEKRIDGASNNR